MLWLIFVVGFAGKDLPESARSGSIPGGLRLHAEQRGFTEVGDNVGGALWANGENAGDIKQGLATLRSKRH